MAGQVDYQKKSIMVAGRTLFYRVDEFGRVQMTEEVLFKIVDLLRAAFNEISVLRTDVDERKGRIIP